jgi:hypothetical protein
MKNIGYPSKEEHDSNDATYQHRDFTDSVGGVALDQSQGAKFPAYQFSTRAHQFERYRRHAAARGRSRAADRRDARGLCGRHERLALLYHQHRANLRVFLTNLNGVDAAKRNLKGLTSCDHSAGLPINR